MRVIVFADYYQLHVRDGESVADLSAGWRTDALRRRFVSGADAVAIVTARDTEVPVDVHVYPERPALNLSGYDHVIECDLLALSGTLIVGGATDYVTGAAVVDVPAGLLRLRASFAGLATVSADGVDGLDVYDVAVWPAVERSAPVVFHQFDPTSA